MLYLGADNVIAALEQEFQQYIATVWTLPMGGGGAHLSRTIYRPRYTGHDIVDRLKGQWVIPMWSGQTFAVHLHPQGSTISVRVSDFCGPGLEVAPMPDRAYEMYEVSGEEYAHTIYHGKYAILDIPYSPPVQIADKPTLSARCCVDGCQAFSWEVPGCKDGLCLFHRQLKHRQAPPLHAPPVYVWRAPYIMQNSPFPRLLNGHLVSPPWDFLVPVTFPVLDYRVAMVRLEHLIAVDGPPATLPQRIKGELYIRKFWVCRSPYPAPSDWLSGWSPHQEIAEPEPEQDLEGKLFVITGALSRPRTDIAKLIEMRGGSVASAISRKVDFLIVGTKPGSKLAKARALGIPTVTEKEVLG